MPGQSALSPRRNTCASRRVRRSCRQPARCTSTNSGGAPVRGRRTIKTKVGLGVGYGTLHQGCLRHCRLPTRPGGALAFDVHGCCACFGLALGHCLCGSGARLAGRRGASARMQGLHSPESGPSLGKGLLHSDATKRCAPPYVPASLAAATPLTAIGPSSQLLQYAAQCHAGAPPPHPWRAGARHGLTSGPAASSMPRTCWVCRDASGLTLGAFMTLT